jgi:hypothetical protein
MKNFTIPSGLTAACGHSGLLGRSPASWSKAAAFGWPMPSGARLACGHHAVHGQCSQHGELTSASPELEQQQGFHPGHPHGSIYEPQHLNLEEVAGKGVLTIKAVGAASTNDVKGGNDFKVGEDAPRLPSELHTSVADIRQCLTSDEKHRNESSPAPIEVARMIYGGGKSSGSMILKPRAKGA